MTTETAREVFCYERINGMLWRRTSETSWRLVWFPVSRVEGESVYTSVVAYCDKIDARLFVVNTLADITEES